MRILAGSVASLKEPLKLCYATTKVMYPGYATAQSILPATMTVTNLKSTHHTHTPGDTITYKDTGSSAVV